MRIGIIGLGTVGKGILEILTTRDLGIQLVAVVDRSIEKKKDLLKNIPGSSDIDLILKDTSIDAVVELIGGIDTALYIARSALDANKHLITANKALLAEHGYALFQLARKQQKHILFEAAIAGAIPIVRNIESIFRYEKINNLRGILNGTTNYILTRMRKEGRPYAEILKDAQAHGLAESDPTLDVQGFDAGQKLALLVSLITGEWVESKNIPVRGITEITSLDVEWSDKFNQRLRLVAEYLTQDGKHYMHVTPMLVSEQNELHDVEYENNAIAFSGEFSQEHLFTGKGAGKLPTAFSVLSDLMHLKEGKPKWISESAEKYLPIADIAETSCAFYLRLRVKDQRGVLAAIAQILGNNALSIASVHQNAGEHGITDLVIHTHKEKRKFFYSAMNELKKLENLISEIIYIPILE